MPKKWWNKLWYWQKGAIIGVFVAIISVIMTFIIGAIEGGECWTCLLFGLPVLPFLDSSVDSFIIPFLMLAGFWAALFGLVGFIIDIFKDIREFISKRKR